MLHDLRGAVDTTRRDDRLNQIDDHPLVKRKPSKNKINKVSLYSRERMKPPIETDDLTVSNDECLKNNYLRVMSSIKNEFV